MINTVDLCRLESSTKIEVIGDYPQIIGLKKGHSLKQERAIENFADYKGVVPPSEPDLKNCLLLHSKSKQTDLVSCSLGPGNDVIVSSKLKDIIDKFSAGPFKSYKCNLFQRDNEIRGYHWIHFLYDLVKEVEFKMSKFNIGPNKVKGINSYTDYVKFSKEKDPYGFLRAEELILPPSFVKLDFFMVGDFDQNIYISERFANMLMSEGISGIEISKPLDSSRSQNES